MNPKSHTLFHFTKSLDVLKSIVRDGFWPKYCLEDAAWMGHDGLERVAYPMVCFCDIPLSRIDEHVDFYGEYGIGMTKEWAMANGLNPVSYVSGDNSFKKVLTSLTTHFPNYEDAEGKEAMDEYMHLISYVKPVEGTMVLDGKPVPKEFYQESEWRLVPRSTEVQNGLLADVFADVAMLKKWNDKSKLHCSLKFAPTDVKYIFVKSDADIPQMMQFIDTTLDHYPFRDVKVLTSRITSLESVKHDF